MKTVTKIAALALSVLFVMQVSVFAQTANEIYAFYSQEKNAIIVGGVSPYGEDTVATVSISKNGALFYFNFARTESNGDFRFECSMNSSLDESGVYSVTVGGAALDAAECAGGVVFVNAADSARILAEVEQSTPDTIREIITSPENIELIDIDVDGDILSLNNSNLVFASLAGKKFDSIPALRSAFNAAVAIEFFNEASAEQGESLLQKYADSLGIDTKLLFDRIKTDELKKDVYNAVCSQDIILTAEAFGEIFNKACYTALFNGFTSSDREIFISYIEACNAANYTDVNLSEYSKLSSDNKVNLVKNVISAKNTKKFKDLKDVEAAFAKVLKAVTEPKKRDDGGGGGKVISIGGGSGGIKKPDKTDTDDNKQNNESEIKKPGLFNDLESVPWAKEQIETLAAKGVANGVGGSSFNPQGMITREEFIKLAAIGFDLPDEKTNNTFTDVKESDWFYEPVMRAFALGIVNGVDFDLFGTGSMITREQLCTIVYRIMLMQDVRIEVNDMSVEIADKDDISDYAKDAAEAMYRSGIVSGVGNGRFAPKEYATRAQAAKIIYEAMERMGKI